MKYVIRAAPILVALALFVSFLVVQQDRSAQADDTVTGLAISVVFPTDAGETTNPDHVSSNANVAMAGRTVTVRVMDVHTDAPVATIENDTSGVSAPVAMAGGPPNWIGTFTVVDSTEADEFVGTKVVAEDGDIIRVSAGFFLVDFTVDSDAPDMNESDLVPADGAISGDGLTSVSGKATDDGAGVAEEDITVIVGGTDIPASLISFTELEDEGGWSFSTFVNVTEAAHTLQITAIDGAGNAGFSDSDDDTDCVVNNTGGTLNDVGDFCDVNEFYVDTTDPDLIEAFTGLAFDEDSEDCDQADCALDENKRDWILAVFHDVNDLDGSSIDDEDFLIDGDAPKNVKWFDEDGWVNNDAGDGRWLIRKVVFIQLDEELAADATPEVNLGALAAGIQDEALNINNIDQVESEDKIGPLFQVEDFDPPPSSSSLVGDEVEVTFTITADEETDSKPDVSVEDVFKPGSELSASVTSSGTNKWDVTIAELSADTATIYNVFISGEDTEGNASDLGIANVDVADPEDLNDNATTTEPDLIIDRFFDTITDTEDDSTTDDYSGFTASDINEDAIYFEGDNRDLGAPVTVPEDEAEIDFRNPFFVSLDFSAEGSEFKSDDHGDVELISAELNGDEVCIFSDSEDCNGESMVASTADGSKWLIAVTDIELGDQELVINASDDAGNDLNEGEFILEFTVTERAPIEVALNPGWNLVSLPGNPVDPSIDAVMANTPAVEAVITYDPTVPGGFLVALRDEDGGDFSGTLKTMNASRGYWVLTDNFEGIEVDVPPLGTGAGVLPPTVKVAEGWNLLPVQDPTGVFGSGDDLRAANYFTSATDVSAVYQFDTIANAWVFIDITDTEFDAAGTCGSAVTVGKSYWVFSTESGTLVPVPISSDATDAEISAKSCD